MVVPPIRTVFIDEDDILNLVLIKKSRCLIKHIFVAILAYTLIAASTYANAQTLAFPGAEGFGRYAKGGRGGIVYVVTSLGDYDESADEAPIFGTLRYGIEKRFGIGRIGENEYETYIPRTIVFAVAGTIKLKRKLTIRTPLLTIAGQTAPGDGIAIRDYGLNIRADDIIIRYIRSRLGNESGVEEDAISVKLSKNIIIDHCSISWSVDEAMSNLVDSESFANKTGDVDLMTVQWSIISESLNDAGHDKGEHGYGGIIGGYRQSYHHNLFAHHNSRSPKITWRRHTQVDFRNNVIYNWGKNSNFDGTSAHVNWVNNYYKPGPATQNNVKDRIFQIYNRQDAPDLVEKGSKFYFYGNYVEGFDQVSADNWLGVDYRDGTTEGDHRFYTPFNYPPISQYFLPPPYQNQYSGSAVMTRRMENVLRYAGASHARDSVDARVVDDVRFGRASNMVTNEFGQQVVGNGIIDSQEEVGGWPDLAFEGRPFAGDLRDSDYDGMPDVWEDANGLNKYYSVDSSFDLDGDGYTEIEEYINSLVPYEGIELRQ